MGIAWVTHNLSPSIKKYVMFINLTKDMCCNLKNRFFLTNGSRKYKVCKELFETKQQRTLSNDEYYTATRSL